MSEPLVQLASPWIHPTGARAKPESARVKAPDAAADVLFFSPWIMDSSVSPTFQIIREELSHCSRIVTRRFLEQHLNASEIDNYTDVIRYAKRYPVSLGILSLAAYLKSQGLKVAYRQLEADREKCGSDEQWLETAVRNHLNEHRPSLVGVGGVTSEIPRIRRLCALVREYAPEICIVAGGPHVSFRPEDLLEDGLADIVVQGEGEAPMLEIARRHLDGKPINGIPGTFVWMNGEVQACPQTTALNLTDLPQPDYAMLSPEMKEKGIIYAMYTRACPYKCSYCSEGHLFGSRLRNHGVSAFVDTLEYIANELNWRFIHIADSTFGLPPKALTALLDELERRRCRFLFSVNVRPDMYRYISEETVRRMRDLGFIEFLIGSESASNSILKAAQRSHTTDDLLKTLRLLKNNGIPFVSTYWMVGLPFETLETITETAKFIKRLLDEDLVFYASAKPFIPLPGTPIFSRPDDFGIRIRSYDWNLYERYSLPLPHTHANLSVQEIESATLLLQSIQAAVFQRRAGESLYEEVEKLNERISDSYQKAVYL